MTTTTRERYVVTFAPMPDPDGIDPVRRLAQLLKVAGRRFKLRCVRATEERPTSPQIPAATATGTRCDPTPKRPK